MWASSIIWFPVLKSLLAGSVGSRDFLTALCIRVHVRILIVQRLSDRVVDQRSWPDTNRSLSADFSLLKVFKYKRTKNPNFFFKSTGRFRTNLMVLLTQETLLDLVSLENHLNLVMKSLLKIVVDYYLKDVCNVHNLQYVQHIRRRTGFLRDVKNV